jgi:hypothetical protein
MDEQGRKIYRGFITTRETEHADKLLKFLQDEIPKIGKLLQEQYGDGVLYKYYLGKRLGELIEEYEIPERERLYFWNEIKNFAADKERIRADGSNSKTRKFYEQCYELSKIKKTTVEKLSWRQWQDLLDRVANREDKRIYEWIERHEPKIKEDEWRSFEKALNQFLKEKDTSVFEDEELFEIYEMILMMAGVWIREYVIFSKEYPKSAKIKSKAKWERKYYLNCFKARKENKIQLNDEICTKILKKLVY